MYLAIINTENIPVFIACFACINVYKLLQTILTDGKKMLFKLLQRGEIRL